MAYVADFAGASTQIDREAGFRSGLAEAGQQLFARAEGNFDYKTAQAAARELFATSKRPDAVFVSNDHMASLSWMGCDLSLGLRCRMLFRLWVLTMCRPPLGLLPSPRRSRGHSICDLKSSRPDF